MAKHRAKFRYVLTHTPTGRAIVREDGFDSWNAFYKQLDAWNQTGGGVWVHWSYGGADPDGTVLNKGRKEFVLP